MFLAVDAGNSATKLALVTADTVGPVRSVDGSAGAAELATVLRDVATGSGAGAGVESGPGGRPSAVILVSVVPLRTGAIAALAADMGLPLVVADGETVPLPVRLAGPGRLGTDRLLSAWTAREIHGAPVIVVDMGTATTVDAVDAEGCFSGGAILPGLGLSLEALSKGTAQLPRVEVAPPDQVLGRDTQEAMRSGVVLGHVGAIRELVARIRLQLDAVEVGRRQPVVVVTGGFSASPWAEQLFLRPAGPGLARVADVVDPHLTLRGLGLLGERALAAAAGVPR